MSELVAVGLKITAELRERLKARAAVDDTSVSALLALGVDMVLGDVKPVPVDSGELAAAQARVTKLEHELVIWKNVASGTKTMHPDAVTAARPRSPGLPVRLTQEPIDPKASHPAGSILKHAVPSKVSGNTVGFNLKGMKA